LQAKKNAEASQNFITGM
jgi:hypothetical protein